MGLKTVNEIAQQYGVHPTQVNQWKKDLLDNAGSVFDKKRGPKVVSGESEPDRLYAKIGQLNMELDWLKKVGDRPVTERQAWIAPCKTMPLSKKCTLLNVTRSVVYQKQKRQQGVIDPAEQMLLNLLDEQYTRRPFKGTRKMVRYLLDQEHVGNRKRVKRLMRSMGLAAMAPEPNTSKAHPEHKVYPRGVDLVPKMLILSQIARHIF